MEGVLPFFEEAKTHPKLLPALERAKEIIAESVEAVWLVGREHLVFSVGCFELMGWDFVIDECPDGTWRPLLLESNHRPGFGARRPFIEQFIKDALDLVLFAVYGDPRQKVPTQGRASAELPFDHIRTIVISSLKP